MNNITLNDAARTLCLGKGLCADLPVLRIVQTLTLSWSGSLDSPLESHLKLTHRSFLLLAASRPGHCPLHDRRIENRVSRFSKSRCHDLLVPDFPISTLPISSNLQLTLWARLVVHTTSFHMTSVLPPFRISWFLMSKCTQPLVPRIPNSLNPDMTSLDSSSTAKQNQRP
jgi:hypothetical protein